MTAPRGLQLLSREDLDLADGLENWDGSLASVSQVFQARDLPLKLTSWTLIVDSEPAPSALGSAVEQALAHQRPSIHTQSDPKGDFIVGVLPGEHAAIVHFLATLPTSDYRWRRLEREVSKSRSGLSPFTLDLAQFQGLARLLSEVGTVTVSRTTGRSVEDGSSITRGWSRDRPEFDIAFQELISHPAAVRTITYWVGKHTNLQVRFNGGASLYRGDAELFQNVVLSQLSSAAQLRAELLRDRARPINEKLSTALRIHFSSPPFGSPEALEELVRLLYSDSELGVAVLHANPYFHATITDYSIASTADVFVTEPSELTIFPGYRASMGFLSRLADRIADRFPLSHIAAVDAHPRIAAAVLLSDD